MSSRPKGVRRHTPDDGFYHLVDWQQGGKLPSIGGDDVQVVIPESMENGRSPAFDPTRAAPMRVIDVESGAMVVMDPKALSGPAIMRAFEGSRDAFEVCAKLGVSPHAFPGIEKTAAVFPTPEIPETLSSYMPAPYVAPRMNDGNFPFHGGRPQMSAPPIHPAGYAPTQTPPAQFPSPQATPPSFEPPPPPAPPPAAIPPNYPGPHAGPVYPGPMAPPAAPVAPYPYPYPYPYAPAPQPAPPTYPGYPPPPQVVPAPAPIEKALQEMTNVLSGLARRVEAVENGPKPRPPWVKEKRGEDEAPPAAPRVPTSFLNLDLPFLVGPEPVRPDIQVIFSYPNGAKQTASYHYLTSTDEIIALLYDCRYKDGSQVCPPITKPDESFSIFVRNLNKGVPVVFRGISISLGALDLIILELAPEDAPLPVPEFPNTNHRS